MLDVVAITVAAVAFWAGLRAAPALAAAYAVSGIARPLLAPLRASWPRPYTGAGLALFIGTEVVLFLAPAAALLACAGRLRSALAFWVAVVAAVAMFYPALRADALLRFYVAVYGAAYVSAMVALTWRSARAGAMSRDQLGVMLLAASGTAATILVVVYGPERWWLTWIPNGTAYVGVLALAIAERRAHRSRPRPR